MNRKGSGAPLVTPGSLGRVECAAKGSKKGCILGVASGGLVSPQYSPGPRLFHLRGSPWSPGGGGQAASGQPPGLAMVVREAVSQDLARAGQATSLWPKGPRRAEVPALWTLPPKWTYRPYSPGSRSFFKIMRQSSGLFSEASKATVVAEQAPLCQVGKLSFMTRIPAARLGTTPRRNTIGCHR